MARKLMISAGHSTSPLAAGTQANGFKEEELTLELRDLVVARLRALGLEVITDGAHGISRPLVEAINLARGCDIAVEFHFNAGARTDTGPFALSVASRKRFGVDLAKAVANAAGLPLYQNGWVSDTRSQHGQLGFCRRGGRGVVLEVCQQSNLDDMRRYNASKEKVADALAERLKYYAETSSRIYDDSLPDEPPVRVRRKGQVTGSRKRVGRR